MSLSTIGKYFIIAALFAAVASTQFLYDATKITAPTSANSAFSASTVRMIDGGFHATAASFLWVSTMPEILDLFRNRTEYLTDVSFINQVDPKLSYPYAFSVLTLPAIPTSTGFMGGIAAAMAIGQRGLENADPDWRIAYYIATNYFLDFKDIANAQRYFDVAAQTPGIPYYAKRFAENFGAEQRNRDRTRDLWITIRDTTNDPDTKARAQAYIDRLAIFDYLEAAAAQYKKIYGLYPATLNRLVQKKVIPALPQDPFGFTFTLEKDGTIGIDLTLLPTSTAPGAQ